MNNHTEQKYTLALYSRNKVGILNRITAIFSRIKLNIDSLSVCETEKKGVYRYSINVNTTEKLIKRITGQINKQIDVIKATYTTDEHIVQQEVALYKIQSSTTFDHDHAEKIIRDHHARILSMHKNYTVIEKTGHHDDTQQLFNDLKPFGILEFVRSGPISISKSHTS